MRSDVAADAVAEDLFSEKTLQHSQKRLALFVRDIVGCAVDLASPSIACSLAIPARLVGSRGKFLRSQTSHFGLKWAVHFVPIQDANPSLSHRLSHQAMVTRSPNHWCAISCASTS